MMRGATASGLDNLVPTQGDATDLLFEDASMDAVILTAVLGEIPAGNWFGYFGRLTPVA